ncbi:hypothetical protein PENCOP_c015G00305 [Penicillium coprophilum]|uniref:Homeobox domain-containing protein n=1 Tax=Penicillium coprophilum TaxID=36646 RepID=A0A1V6UAC5_9EURO|nr:hypothetical protein PENCOP_c015G00305 [Penicillium coprophilum]
MDINDPAEDDFLLQFLTFDDHPQCNNLDTGGSQGVPQGGQWANYDDISQFGSEASSLPRSSSTAGAYPYTVTRSLDGREDIEDLSESLVQSLPIGSSERGLTNGWDSKHQSTSDHIPGSRSYRRLPSEAVKFLRLWLHQHQGYPYPTHKERQEMEQQTGLDKNQILNWFSNARRRKRKHLKHISMPIAEANTGAVSFMSPMERWQHSPPETEPAATSDIMRALRAASPFPNPSPLYYSDPGPRSGDSSGSSLLLSNPSMSSFEHSDSSGGPFGDSQNYPPTSQFQRPPTPIPSMKPRRRLPKAPSFRNRRDKAAMPSSRTYQCTFCCDSFRNKYDWLRHEKSRHISIDRWKCAPNGGMVEIDGVSVCAYCHSRNIDDDHLETHNYLRCRDKPPELRVFTRKDHLRQHLRSVHNVEYHSSLDKWCESTTSFRSRCGFCNSNFETWEERVDHVAEHFKEGADMSQWTGDWGFDPEVERQVGNAMAPYLLGIERRTVDPMKSSNVPQVEDEGDASCSANADFPKGVDLYTILHNSLVAYIRDQMLIGVHPSDEMIQSRARWVIYGSDDPWNQTFAEVPAWLAALKREAGLLEPLDNIFDIT